MSRTYRGWMATILPALLLPLAAIADVATPPAEDMRLQLEKIRQDPPREARLKRNLAAFRKLPPESQERLRKLDRDLAEESIGMRGRLNRAMERYHAWLEQLSEEDRASVEQIADRKARLQRIRDLRTRDLVRRLPRAQQEQIKVAKEGERPALTQKLLQEDGEQRADAAVAERFSDGGPKGFMLVSEDTLTPDARRFVERALKPLLSKEEEKRLKEAEGKWPRYGRVLIELADNHPLSLLGPIGPTRVDDMKWNKKHRELFKDRFRDVEGKWPEFGVALREAAAKFPGDRVHLDLPARLMPSRPKDFPTAVQQFLDKRLLPALSEDERQSLSRAEGTWPGYPRMVVELARRHNLLVPSEVALPGPVDWDKYRARSLSTGDSTR